MTKKTRRIIFYLAIVVFLCLSYVAVLYAQGYKYSFADGKFYKTGSIYLKANRAADVYLNNLPTGSTSFLNHSFTIASILPGQYEVALADKDLYPWHKEITVQEGLVTEFPKIILLDVSPAGRHQLVHDL